MMPAGSTAVNRFDHKFNILNAYASDKAIWSSA